MGSIPIFKEDNETATEKLQRNIIKEDQKRLNKTLNENLILDQIQEIRTKNNTNWMSILKLAFQYAPDEAKAIMKNITECDKEVSKLCEEITK